MGCREIIWMYRKMVGGMKHNIELANKKFEIQPAEIIFDQLGYAIAVIWKLPGDNFTWRGRLIHDSSKSKKQNLLYSREAILEWIGTQS